MNRARKIMRSVLLICVLFVCCFYASENLFNGLLSGSAAINVYVGETDENNPFFESEFLLVDPSTAGSINKNYDKFAQLNNPTNFQSRGVASYANINGKTVTADAFYKDYNKAVGDPNVGFGLMVYQCIQYKIKHPDADVKMTFSTYHLSVTSSVCVLPESKFYGYMQSLYDVNYDQHGFVRIAYMLVEAARMGIDVLVISQTDSYAVKQYNDAGKLFWKGELDHLKYFNAGMGYKCYDKYAKGKIVSDFFSLKHVKWALEDKGSTDMMHLKACTVSNYISRDGVEHGPAVWFSSTNLDATNYKGCNGHNGSQSGVIISEHDEIYNITRNYQLLMGEYDGIEELHEFQHLVNLRNTEQAAMIRNGQAHLIPKEERLIYLGSETDDIFELTFTPIAGYTDTWDTENNPYCKYASKLLTSTDYIIYNFNCPTFAASSYIGDTLQKVITKAFTENKNPKNRLCIKVNDFRREELTTLIIGKDIAFNYLGGGGQMHNKDMLFSYEENGKRYYISLLSSCNFHIGAFSYQTNSLLTIKETEDTGSVFFTALGRECASGII